MTERNNSTALISAPGILISHCLRVEQERNCDYPPLLNTGAAVVLLIIIIHSILAPLFCHLFVDSHMNRSLCEKMAKVCV